MKNIWRKNEVNMKNYEGIVKIYEKNIKNYEEIWSMKETFTGSCSGSESCGRPATFRNIAHNFRHFFKIAKVELFIKF